jgi:hypothetical protein
MERSETCLIGRAGAIAKMRLPKGRRFVVIQYDSAPHVVPIDDPGHYEIDVTPFVKEARFPVAIMVVKAKHCAAFTKVSPEHVNKILDACVSTVRRSILQ